MLYKPRCNFGLTLVVFLACALFGACGGSAVQVGYYGLTPFVQVSLVTQRYEGELPLEVWVNVSSFEIEEASFSINWGDGGGWFSGGLRDGNGAFQHIYQQAGTYTIRVKALSGTKLHEHSVTLTAPQESP
jgi:hypothetical protein